MKNYFKEDEVPVNNVGDGNIAGTGNSPSDPPIFPKKHKQLKKLRDILRRNKPVMEDARWEEGKHPRGQPKNKGEFRAKGKPDISIVSSGKSVPMYKAEGRELPDHIKALKIPPGWKDVHFNPDPESHLHVTAKDSKDRVQYVYSSKFTDAQQEAKFHRINELNKKASEVFEENEINRKSDNPRLKDAADCMALIFSTGIRPGSDEDTSAKVKAFGATTLTGSHVKIEGKNVYLIFVGKKGVNLKIPVEDEDVAHMLVKRSYEVGPEGQLFPKITDRQLRDYTTNLDGGGFKTKDFRTLIGSRTAMHLVSTMPKPTTPVEYKKAVMDVAKLVSKKLGNTPIVALQSYIDPSVFNAWRIDHNE